MYLSVPTLVFAGAVTSVNYLLTDWNVSTLFQQQRDIEYIETMNTVYEYLEQQSLDVYKNQPTSTGIHELESISDTDERLIHSANTILENSLVNQYKTEKSLRKKLLLQFITTYFITCGVWYGINLVV